MSDTAPNPNAPLDRPVAIAATRAVWLVIIFFAGLILVVSLKAFFAHLQDELNLRSANERARQFIGEEIVRAIQHIERDVFYMTSLNNDAALVLTETQITKHVDKLRHDLNVLRVGGSVRQVANLNIEGRDEMVREMRYQPEGRSAFIMEIIEIGPLIDQIEPKTRELRQLLGERIHARASQGHKGFYDIEQQIGAHLKHLPPFFFRLEENANRLFFESSDRLARLEQDIDVQRQRYTLMETLSVVLVIIVATLAGILFARQIRDSNQRLRLAWEEMRQAKEEAERASRAKSDFVSRMSHELRTPMNAILGFGQLLQEEDLEPDQRDYVNEINSAGTQLLELINQVLDLAKIEAGRMTLESIPFDPMRTVDEVATVIAEQARAKGLKLRFFASPDLPARIYGDPTRLRQVLINLVGNAVKFTETGTIDLRIEPADGMDRIRYQVEDTGIGMNTKTLAGLFKPFSQGDESTTRRYGGTGLGLSISKDLVQAMGGTLEVSSATGVGSRFWFELPAPPDPEASARPTPLRGYRAMLSCGEDHLLEVLTAQLSALGAEIMPRHSIEEIIRMVAEEPGQPWLFAGEQGCLNRLDARSREMPITRLIRLRIPGGPDIPGRHDASLHAPFTYTRLLDLISQIQADQADTTTTPCARPPLSDRRDDNSVHVLLVEDSQLNQIVATRLLDKLGIPHDIASDGAAALDMLGRRPYDLVLMDIQMPRLDGYEATRALRVRELETGAPRLPVVAMTASAMLGDRERCLDAGMDDHIPKPIELDALAVVLNRWLPTLSKNNVG